MHGKVLCQFLNRCGEDEVLYNPDLDQPMELLTIRKRLFYPDPLFFDNWQ